MMRGDRRSTERNITMKALVSSLVEWIVNEDRGEALTK
jgi:hypothetical protein